MVVSPGMAHITFAWSQMESLKKGDYVRKDKHDEKTLLANLYDPDDTKTHKSNKRREKERARDKHTGKKWQEISTQVRNGKI